MAFTQQDVADKAIIIGNLDSLDTSLMERLNVTIEMVVAKTEAYIGYECTEVDALRNILAEISVIQLSRYKDITSGSTNASGTTKRISRGDYTVEYNTSLDVWNQHEWLLKKYKKLVTI